MMNCCRDWSDGRDDRPLITSHPGMMLTICFISELVGGLLTESSGLMKGQVNRARIGWMDG